MRANEFIKEASATKRKGIVHLQKMKDLEFIQFIRKLGTEFQNTLGDVKVSLKVDGAGFRFGKDEHGKLFVETSRSGPIDKPGAFSAFVKAKGGNAGMLNRAKHYDDIYNIIINSNFIKGLPKDSKVIAEIFYNPMADDAGDTIKFVNVAYYKSKLGSLLTLILFDVTTASTGEPHPNKESIMEFLYDQSTSEIKILSPNLVVSGDIDITGKVDPIDELDDEAIRVLSSRKHIDRPRKKEIQQVIQGVKDKLADYILNHPNILGKYDLGKEIEGLVLDVDGENYKVTTPQFKSFH